MAKAGCRGWKYLEILVQKNMYIGKESLGMKCSSKSILYNKVLSAF